MERTYFFVSFYFILNILNIIYGYQTLRTYTEPQVITTPNYPDPYPPYFNCTWRWAKESGIWAVLFEHLDVSCDDWVYVEDIKSNKKSPEGCSHSTVSPIYIHGPLLEIRFSTSDNRQSHSGFKIRILSGDDLDDVKGQVYDLKQKEKETKEPEKNHVYFLLLYILVAIVVFIVCFVAVWVVYFNRQRRNLSVAVSTNNIRRDTGVSYKRSASTSESITSRDTEHTNVDIERKRVTRTPSQRSWTTRAALATKSNVVIDNLYSPMGHYANQINRPLSALVEYDPLSKPVPSANVHPTTISGYEAPVLLK